MESAPGHDRLRFCSLGWCWDRLGVSTRPAHSEASMTFTGSLSEVRLEVRVTGSSWKSLCCGHPWNMA